MAYKNIPLFISIRSKVYGVIAIVTLFAVILSLVSWALFQTFSNTLQTITRESTPTSLTVSKLALLSANLNLDFNVARSSRNKNELITSYSRMIKHITKMRVLLEYLQDLSKEKLESKDLYKELSDIERLTKKINIHVGNDILFKEAIKKFSKELEQLQNHFMTLIAPIADDAFFNLATSEKEKITTGFFENTPTFLAEALELKSEGNLLFGILSTIENLSEIDRLVPLKEKFQASQLKMKRLIKKLLEQPKKSSAPLKTLEKTVMRMIDGGTGANNIFTIKEAQFLNQKNLLKVKENIQLSTDKITNALYILEKSIKLKSDRMKDNAENQIITGRLLTFIIALFSIIVSSFVGWWVVGRNITDRLNKLRESLAEVSSGNLKAEIPQQGMDEVAHMGQALSTFRDNVRLLKNDLSRNSTLMNMLQQGSSAIHNANTFEDAVTACLQLINTDACWMCGHMFLLNEAGNTLEATNLWAGDINKDFKKTTSMMEFKLGEGLPGRVMSSNRSLFVKDIQSERGLPREKIFKKAGIKSAYFYPIYSGDTFFGVMEFFSKDPWKFNKDLNAIIETILKQLGAHIQRLKTETALRKEKEKAQAETNAKGTFLSSMSHEIKTPLDTALKMSNLILASTLQSDQRQWIQTIKKANTSLLDIMNDVFDFSQLESNKLILDSVPFNLYQTIEDVFDRLRLKFTNKTIAIYNLIETDVPLSLIGDPKRLCQVLTNLIGNAIKFTKSGHVTLKVSVIKDLKNAIQLSFRIEDTGIGIHEDKIASAFNAFSEINPTSNKQIGRTGLGLSICAKLIQLMKGKIEITSEFGEGSQFFFDLTLEKYISLENNDMTDQYHTISLEGQHALIVEEDDITSDIIKKYLRSFSLSVKRVTSEKECIKLLNQDSKNNISYDYIFVNSALIDHNPILFSQRLKGLKNAENAFKIHLVNELYPTESNEITSYLDAQLLRPLQPQTLKNCLILLSKSREESKPMTQILDPASINRLIKEKNTALTRKSDKFKGLHILVVEDNKENMTLIRRNLESLGATISIAVNGKEAVTLFKEEAYDLIFMDCQMPEMDGYEATRLIRRVISKPQCPIIALTANKTPGNKDKCLASGMDDYLNKPLKKEKLIKTIERWAKISSTKSA